VTNVVPMDRQRPPQRVPPHDLTAEESLLGAMLLTARAIDDTAGIVTPDDMYKPAHTHIHHAITTLHARGEPADPVTVADELRRDNLMDAIGGPATLIALQANTPATSNAARYARIVADHALLRRLIAAAGEIAELGYSLPDDPGAAVDQAEAILTQITQGQGHVETVVLHEALDTWLEHLQALYDRGEPDGIMTGLADLDQLLLGLRPGQLVVIAGRPSVGKSLLGSQIAIEAAMRNRPAMLVGIEMPTEETVGRIVAAASRVDHTHIRSGKLTDRDWPRISDAIGRLAELPLHLVDDPAASVATIRSAARRQAAHGGLDLLVVDYMQLVDPGQKGENRQVDVAAISKGLRRIARELKIPVVALAQLNRTLEYRADKRPVLADLRESGQIEADADVVIGIYRDEIYHPDSTDKNVAELLVLKQRNGPLGLCRCAFLEMMFRNLSRM
jgi:replicative DNA helicase